jgi:hypothetical protein
MNNEQFKETLNKKGYSYTENDGNITVNYIGYVDLSSLTTLPAGTKFENQGDVDLSSLTTLPEGTKFENQGDVDLRLLTTLSEGTKFENQGGVDLRSLTSEKQNYQGKEITLRNIDGYTMLIESEKITKGVTICKASYFGGGDLDKCYLVKVGNHWAHGGYCQDSTPIPKTTQKV